MIGKFQIQLGADQLISGMSSSDYSTDGALGTSCTNLNPFSTPGIIRATATPTDASTNLSGNLVATSDDSQTVAPVVRVAIDDAGNIYSWGGSSWTKQITGLANTYSFPESDILPFYGHNYATSTTKLMQINTSAWTKTENFQSLTDASALHPLLEYQQNLWVGDGKHLASLQSDEATWNADAAWVLGGNEKIVALGIDPATGLMMVSVQTAYNPTDSLQQRGIIYLYDGIASKPIRKIIVDDLVTAFYNIEGNVYVGMGSGTIGVWNGNGVTFLRKLNINGTFLKTDLPYKHHFANIRNILMVVDGTNVLGYGAVVADKRGFFYIGANTINSNNIGVLTRAGSNKLGLGFASNKFETYDIASIAANSAGAHLYFNNIYFPRPVFIRRMRIVTTGITQTNAFGIGSVHFIDEKNHTYGFDVTTFIVPTGQTFYDFDFDYTSAKVMGIQPQIQLDTQGFGIVRVYIYYDIAE